MERDFMGLNSKDSVVVVKEEAVEGCQDSAFSKGSAVQWPFSSKVSALPHFMSFKVAQEEKTARATVDPISSPGIMAISTVDAFEATHKRPLGEMQNNVFPMHYSHDAKMLQATNPFFKTHYAGAGQNFAGASMKQPVLGGNPVTAPHSVHLAPGSVAGAAEPWFTSKSSGAPAQLTIFYAGTVNVYNDISPEKAQAIMFLAGNGITNASNMAQPRAQVQVPASKQAGGDGVLVNQPNNNTSPNSALSSPMSVSSHPVGQPGSGLAGNDEAIAVKPTSNIPVSKVDSPKLVTSLGPLAATTMIPSAVPQARKASLARFLEKRKERAMNSAPYNPGKKSPECATPGSNSAASP